ncbi:hypothetical protein H6F98_15690 [Microcoleus sp. FACHB-SPT15]|uniref:hormogonium polysaccharide biosynthesis protein HpsA n=1 Tax=Microcoleus sp. FACHB-SPT15 TaxID=2692830 RepID=UPI00177A7D3F|nr:hormogonium polysaccharide biosynthesis protein HpsA [Microcoleus sp. FACHB-SPT15]MBD1806889.1 hypothetical protein [Microcoleus sp. FACHB-SPT15]
MSIPKKPKKNPRNLFHRMWKLTETAVKAVVNWILRGLLRTNKRPRLAKAKAGFTLPTTVMVMLVVILLTMAMVMRSFDRNRNAVNARSEQVIQNASTPAIDRAQAKLTALLADPNLPRGTPPDDVILNAMNDEKYTFGDETRLKLAFDFGDGNGGDNQDGTIQTSQNVKNDESLNTAWKYPVDTDGNGLYDSFTLYGLYWRSPKRTGQNFDRPRNPLEARSIPQALVGLGDICETAGQSAATAVGEGDWYQQGGNLSKAFYVYAATVPITSTDTDFSPQPFNADKYEVNKQPNKAFAGLEFQQDRYRAGVNNTSVWYQDDLVIAPGGTFRLNGRVFTNGNLLVGGLAPFSNLQLYQVSSPYSCFYEQVNAKINVGGNVGTGDITTSTNQADVTAYLYKGDEDKGKATLDAVAINGTNKSTTSQGGSQIAYNDAAYNRRITLMKNTALSLCGACTPASTPKAAALGVAAYTADEDLGTRLEDVLQDNVTVNYDILSKELEIYLRNRTRRVPYAEIDSPEGANAVAPYDTDGDNIDTGVFGSGIEPPAAWREPTNANTGVTLEADLGLEQTNPEVQINQNDYKEDFIGDRINVGNNLPAYWKNGDGEYVAAVPDGVAPEAQRQYTGGNWTAGGGARYRTTQLQALDDLGAADRGGFWEVAAGSNPQNVIPGGGGLRIITGAGIYVDDPDLTAPDTAAAYPRAANSFLPSVSWDTKFVDPTETSDPTENKIFPSILQFNGQDPILVWSDLMPMTGGDAEIITGANRKGDLQMRATAVYHYVDNRVEQEGDPPNQTPIACVSSYYDPTNAETATDINAGGKSNNGKVYNYPGRNIGTYQTQLERQARLVFPDGHFANPPLRNAMQKFIAGGVANFTWEDYSAVDTAICSIAILDGTATTSTAIPDGAIKEASFLDAREVKAIDKLRPSDPAYDITSNYNLPLEDRQPLEIRVTDINVGVLAENGFGQFDSNADGTNEDEYLLPNSGIIYASRDDAFPDESNPTDISLSSTDFRLDPKRRPNGIRLVNGLRLARGTGNVYRTEEKGLILATNLPVYVKGHFNPHLPSGTTAFNAGDSELEEFNQELLPNWSNFEERGAGGAGDLNLQFACRVGEPLCEAPGDQWRPATVIADAITVQSVNFKDGYRNQGDFDLRNNAGTPLAGKRAGKGFFDNSFVTSAKWWDNTNANGLPNDESRVSYLLNGVTPIQRRATVIPYPTEECTIVPLSECTPDAWTVEGDTSDVDPTLPNQRYARRVRFKRFGSRYAYDQDGYPEFESPLPTAPVENTLWFQTREADGTPSFDGGTAATSQPFIFQPRYPQDALVGAGELQLPDLGWLRGYAAATNTKNATFSPASLADPDADPVVAADIPATSGAPPHNINPGQSVAQRINDIFDQFTDTNKFDQANVFNLATEKAFLNFNTPDPRTIELTGGGQMRVFSGGNAFPINLNAGTPDILIGDESSVFVFLLPRINLTAGTLAAIKELKLEGVLPENVYWLVERNVVIPRFIKFKGNILAKGGIRLVRSEIEGRILAGGNIGLQNGASVKPPSGNQPRVVPVTQIHSVAGVPGTHNDNGNVSNSLYGDIKTYPVRWLQQASSTNYNIAFVGGDSSLRPSEVSAGLSNFVRLQENWDGPTESPGDNATVTVKGSFIQQKRSSYATAPFATIRQGGNAEPSPKLSLEDGTNADGSLSIFGYRSTRYLTSNGTPTGTLPYYGTPSRQWGFDVGLLSQAPDIFSQKFTQDIDKVQSYYRAVERNDQWIQALLCAAQPANPTDQERVGGSGTSYTQYAVAESERPDCPSPNVTNANLPYPANP